MTITDDVVLEFLPSCSKDVIKYKLYIEHTPRIVNRKSDVFDLGNECEINLTKLLVGKYSSDGLYNIGITAVDITGKESNMTVLYEVPITFSEPEPPGQVCIRRLYVC